VYRLFIGQATGSDKSTFSLKYYVVDNNGKLTTDTITSINNVYNHYMKQPNTECTFVLERQK
jgi:hypothetical protein